MDSPALDRFRDPLTLAVGALAVHRLTRLLVDDEVTRPLRDRIDESARDDEGWARIAYLAHCPRCVSVWVAAGWAGLLATAPRTARVAGAALAWSALAGLLSSLE